MTESLFLYVILEKAKMVTAEQWLPGPKGGGKGLTAK